MEEKQKKRTASVNNLLEQMEKQVDTKISNIKLFIPFIFVVITALLSFVLTSKMPSNDNSTLIVYIIATALLLITFIALIVAYKVKPYYKQDILDKEDKSEIDFCPTNIKSYWKLTDKKFIAELEKYCNKELKENEKIKAKFFKQKVNEYRHRNVRVNVAYGILIGVAVIMTITCIFMLFM